MPAAVVPAPAGVQPIFYAIARETWPAPTLVNGWPNNDTWAPSSVVDGVRGRLQIVWNDTDVTFFRDVPASADLLSWAAPFDYLDAEIAFPQLSIYQAVGAGDTDWVLPSKQYNKLEVYWVDEDDVAEDDPAWAGYLLNWAIRNGHRVAICKGRFRQADEFVRAPGNSTEPVDIASPISTQFNPTFRPSLHHEGLDDDPTGILTRYRGGWEEHSLDYVQVLLSTAYDEATGRQVTVMGRTPTKPEWRLKNTTGTPEWHQAVGARGLLLDSDLAEVLGGNLYYTVATSQAGARNEGKHPVVGGMWYQPAKDAYDSDVHDVDEETDGTLTTVPGRIDPEVRRQEVHVDLGQGYDRAEAAIVAQALYARTKDPSWAGTEVRLPVDPKEGSKFDIRPDQQFGFQYFAGATLVTYINQVVWRRQESGDLDVTLTVDTQARDPHHLDAILKRQKELAANPTRSLKGGRDDMLIKTSEAPWDDEVSGFIPFLRSKDGTSTVTLVPGEWVFEEFVASERDSIIAAYFNTDPAVIYHASLYVQDPREPGFADDFHMPTAPLADGAWDDIDPYLKQVAMWGVYLQRAGFSPKLETGPGDVPTGAPVTGRIVDEDSWDYTHDQVDDAKREPGKMWGAFWLPADQPAAELDGRLWRGPGS